VWKQRALHAEDLIERIRVWHEVLSHSRRLEQIQSEVVRLRRKFPNFCIEMVPVCVDDSWISVSDRKPTLRTPVVEVRFANGEIEESRFWYGAFENDFQRFESTRPDCEITHWREKKNEP